MEASPQQSPCKSKRLRITSYILQSYNMLMICSVMLCFTILRGNAEPLMLRHYIPNTITTAPADGNCLVSPLYAPHGDLSPLYGVCSAATFDVLSDMHNLTQMYLARWRYVSDLDPASNAQVASCDAQSQQIYTRLLRRPPIEEDNRPDWVYESCRLAALIYCRSIVHGTSLAESAGTLHAQRTGHELTSTTLLSALHAAIMRTDTRSCWGDMRGVFLWVCLVGGAASWPPSRLASVEYEEQNPSAQAWARKCFALCAVRSAVSIPFGQAGTTIEALRTMLQVRHWMDLNNSAHRASV
jgi:hypothetical protein